MNGTRCIVTKPLRNVIEVKIAAGPFKNETHTHSDRGRSNVKCILPRWTGFWRIPIRYNHMSSYVVMIDRSHTPRSKQEHQSSVLLMSSLLGDSILVTKLFRLFVYFVRCLPLLLVPQILALNICFSSPSALFKGLKIVVLCF